MGIKLYEDKQFMLDFHQLPIETSHNVIYFSQKNRHLSLMVNKDKGMLVTIVIERASNGETTFNHKSVSTYLIFDIFDRHSHDFF